MSNIRIYLDTFIYMFWPHSLLLVFYSLAWFWLALFFIFWIVLLLFLLGSLFFRNIVFRQCTLNLTYKLLSTKIDDQFREEKYFQFLTSNWNKCEKKKYKHARSKRDPCFFINSVFFSFIFFSCLSNLKCISIILYWWCSNTRRHIINNMTIN